MSAVPYLLMNSPITKRCFVIPDGCGGFHVFFIEIFLLSAVKMTMWMNVCVIA